MKIVGFIPNWSGYEFGGAGDCSRPTTKVGGNYLISYAVELLNSVNLISEIIVFSSSEEIMNYIDPALSCKHLKRPAALDSDTVHIEEIIQSFISVSSADIIVMLHPNSPFLTKESVEDCLANVLSGKHSSAFTACKHNSFAWFNGSPLNYSIGKPTPHLRDLVPVVLEQSSLFVFTRENFHEYTSRVSPEPFIRYIDYFEAHGINSAHELDIAEILVNSGLVKKSIPGSRNRKVLVD